MDNNAFIILNYLIMRKLIVIYALMYFVCFACKESNVSKSETKLNPNYSKEKIVTLELLNLKLPCNFNILDADKKVFISNDSLITLKISMTHNKQFGELLPKIDMDHLKTLTEETVSLDSIMVNNQNFYIKTKASENELIYCYFEEICNEFLVITIIDKIIEIERVKEIGLEILNSIQLNDS